MIALQVALGVRYSLAWQATAAVSKLIGSGGTSTQPLGKNGDTQFAGWAAGIIPPDSAVLFVQPAPSSSTSIGDTFLRYFSLAQRLYPRTVWNAALTTTSGPAPQAQNVDVPLLLPHDPIAFARLLQEKGISYVLARGVEPSDLPTVNRGPVSWFDRQNRLFLIGDVGTEPQ